jgi:oligosaccharide repeat unit polymerase
MAQIESIQNGEPIRSFVLDNFTGTAIFASLLFATEKKDRKFWIVIIVAFIACILSTARGGILALIAGLSAIYLLQTKQESLHDAMRLLRWPIVSFVVLFIGMNFILKSSQTMTQQITTRGVAGTSTFFVLSYIAGPLAAFDSVVQHPADFIMTTSHTFYFPLQLAAMLHLTDFTKPPSMIASCLSHLGQMCIPYSSSIF